MTSMEIRKGFIIKKMCPLLIVKNLNTSIQFYTQMLGFEVDFCYEDFYAGIVKDAYSIHLKLGRPKTTERTNRRANEDLDLIIAVDDIENLYEELRNEPVEIVQPLREMPYGQEFYIADTDGYLIGFLATSLA